MRRLRLAWDARELRRRNFPLGTPKNPLAARGQPMLTYTTAFPVNLGVGMVGAWPWF